MRERERVKRFLKNRGFTPTPNFGVSLYSKRGFTLIELLVVISIIGFLATASIVVFNNVRMKARDARRISDFKALSTGLAFYYDKYGRYPNESPVVTNPWTDNYLSMAQQLVMEGFMPSIPRDPNGSPYNYYNYGGSTIGGLLVTNLEAAPDTTTGISPSCRPWAPAQNWCSQSSSKEYCICNPY